MNLYDVIFYLFAALTLVSGFVVVTSKNIVHAAFYLLFTFFGVAGLYAMLGADFIAVVQIMVYVGGILVLILFGVMLTNKVVNVDIRTGTVKLLPAAIVIGIFAGALIAMMLTGNWTVHPAKIPNTTLYPLGKELIKEYVVIFELLGLLLLVALIGAASIARREKE
jgi:NADH-quinone oxidoreductase subunit J